MGRGQKPFLLGLTVCTLEVCSSTVIPYLMQFAFCGPFVISVYSVYNGRVMLDLFRNLNVILSLQILCQSLCVFSLTLLFKLNIFNICKIFY
jgi:hypothetical protein